MKKLFFMICLISNVIYSAESIKLYPESENKLIKYARDHNNGYWPTDTIITFISLQKIFNRKTGELEYEAKFRGSYIKSIGFTFKCNYATFAEHMRGEYITVISKQKLKEIGITI